MNKQTLKNLIDTAAGRRPADLVITNAQIADVYNARLIPGSVAITDGIIAGIGDGYSGRETIDAGGRIVAPCFIDSHIHIESAFVSPEEIGRMLVPHGTAVLIADPHEIVNVCGEAGLEYMLRAAEKSPLDIYYMLPSCVPATAFETSGAELEPETVGRLIQNKNIHGLGEFMNYVGITSADEACLEKILAAQEAGKPVDGHSPGLGGKDLQAYAASGVLTDHECATPEEMIARITLGMYVLLRYGSACRDLPELAKAVTPENSRRCLLCSDDRQPRTIFTEGHLERHLQLCVEAGIEPMTALRMATLNAAECYGLTDRGAVAPGKKADLVLLDDLKTFHVDSVFIGGKRCAEDGRYLLPVEHAARGAVENTVQVRNFTKERLNPKLTSGHVHVISRVPGGVLTKKNVADVTIDDTGNFVYSPEQDIVKIAVIERHGKTDNVAVGFFEGYGLRRGAIAVSIAHDAHNIICAGTNDDDMAAAVEALIRQQGGVVLAESGEILGTLPMPIAGLMSEKTGEEVYRALEGLYRTAQEALGVQNEADPILSLSFMSLEVIPELKLTDRGLFDVTAFAFIPLEAAPEEAATL